MKFAGIGHWLVNATTMADDYIMGAVLLIPHS